MRDALRRSFVIVRCCAIALPLCLAASIGFAGFTRADGYPDHSVKIVVPFPAGGTADAVIVLKEDDVHLYEGALRLRALSEVLSGTLMVRFQAFGYSAFIGTRFPAAISIITGNTGMAAPGF